MKKQTYLITGATGGIGQELVKQLSIDNNIIAISRSQKSANSLTDLYPDIQTIITDIGTDNGIEDLVNQLKDVQIDKFINLAGVQVFDLFENQSTEQVKQQVHINLTTPMLLINKLLPKLKLQPHAHIINIGSTFGTIGFPHFSAYCGSKFGLRGFTEALSRELSNSNINISYIAPRAVNTNINSSQLNEFAKQTKMNMDTVEFAASQIIKAVESKKTVYYIGFQERMFAKINSIFPSIVAKELIKQNPIAQKILNKS